MSLQAIEWAFNQDIGSSAAKFLLVCLADNVGSDGTCFPSLDLLCKKTNQDRKTVISNLDLLESLYLIEDTGKRIGNGVKEYRFVGLPDGSKHYVYTIINKFSKEFYIGVRSCFCEVQNDKYFGSGAWAIKQNARNVEKQIIGIYKTREEAELAELFYINKFRENELLKNRFFPKFHNVPKTEPVPISELQPIPISEPIPKTEPVPNLDITSTVFGCEPVPNLDVTSTKNGTQNRNEPSIEPSLNRHVVANAKKSKGTRIPDDWVLSKKLGEWAHAEKPHWSIDKIRSEAEAFKDYWLSVAGARGIKQDWDATWRNWVRRSNDAPVVGQTGGGYVAVNKQAALEQRNAEAARQALEQM